MTDLSIIQKLAIWALPVLFAISLHEVAHGLVASWFGDKTAKFAGRLTINPIYHIDLIGTILIPLVTLVMTNFSFIIGWAKPVPVDARNLHHPRRDMALVALAGPLSNVLMAILWGLVNQLGIYLDNVGVVYMGYAGVLINVVFAVLNLIPIPPLDGSKILMSLLPPRLAYRFSLIEPYSFLVLILLLATGFLGVIMNPLINLLLGLITFLLQWI